jgi:hypothetical protein
VKARSIAMNRASIAGTSFVKSFVGWPRSRAKLLGIRSLGDLRNSRGLDSAFLDDSGRRLHEFCHALVRLSSRWSALNFGVGGKSQFRPSFPRMSL